MNMFMKQYARLATGAKRVSEIYRFCYPYAHTYPPTSPHGQDV